MVSIGGIEIGLHMCDILGQVIANMFVYLFLKPVTPYAIAIGRVCLSYLFDTVRDITIHLLLIWLAIKEKSLKCR